MVLCLATNNPHKVEELQLMLGNTFQLKTLSDINCHDEIEETEATLEGNSLLKASYIYTKFGYNAIADDSGLEVQALNNEPGVLSARYAGEHGNHQKNMDLLLSKLTNESNRKAQFRTVITLIVDGEKYQFEGIVEGKIITTKRGTMGFGYDPIFVPDGFEKTFAEMTMEEKNPISHRGKAIEKLLAFLAKK